MKTKAKLFDGCEQHQDDARVVSFSIVDEVTDDETERPTGTSALQLLEHTVNDAEADGVAMLLTTKTARQLARMLNAWADKRNMDFPEELTQ